MSKKDLKYFMRDTQPEFVTVPGIDSFKDSEGKVIDFDIKVLTQSEISEIYDSYKTRRVAKDSKGAPLVANGEVVWEVHNDSQKAVRHILVEALQYPDLKDPELMKHFDCVDVTEMPLKVFSKGDEFSQAIKIVFAALGISKMEEDIDSAKN